MALTEISWRPTLCKSQKKDISPSLRVRRCLFGPVDHEAVRSDLQQEMKAMTADSTSRWNFDFERECPLEGRYLWSKCSMVSSSMVSTPSSSSEGKSSVIGSINDSESPVTTTTTDANIGRVAKSAKNASKARRKVAEDQKITDFLRQKKPCTRSDRYAKCVRKQTRARQMRLDKFCK